jgi:hypothetical protein
VDRFVVILMVALIAIAFIRFRYSYSKSKRNMDKGQQIQNKLRELRKKRDEE